jgi:hypothetical protein
MSGVVKIQAAVFGITAGENPNFSAVEPPLRKAAWALEAMRRKCSGIFLITEK